MILLALPVCYGAPPQESLAEAARKAREQKKNQPKPAKVITNDDLAATPGSVSVVGTAAPVEKEGAGQPQASGKQAAEGKKATPPEEEKGQAYWRKRFAEAQRKLQDAQRELDILQRELNLKQRQYYDDPMKALQEQYNRKEIDTYRQKIADKQKEVEQLRQALSDLEDDLRRAGGDPGWAREP
jgi:chromosome segregation ATPase